MKRTLNIIKRAVEDFGLEVDMQDSLQDIFDQAMNAIDEGTEFDYINECERSRHYDHISWSDGSGFEYEADGEFLSSDDSKNIYFRKSANGDYHKVAWYDHTEDDYVVMDHVIDTYGEKVALICK